MNKILLIAAAVCFASPALAIEKKVYSDKEKQEIFTIIADNVAGKKHGRDKIVDFACSFSGGPESSPLNEVDNWYDKALLQQQTFKKLEVDKYLVAVPCASSEYDLWYNVIIISKKDAVNTALILNDWYIDSEKNEPTKKASADIDRSFPNFSIYSNDLFVAKDDKAGCIISTYYSLNGNSLEIEKETQENCNDSDAPKENDKVLIRYQKQH